MVRSDAERCLIALHWLSAKILNRSAQYERRQAISRSDYFPKHERGQKVCMILDLNDLFYQVLEE